MSTTSSSAGTYFSHTSLLFIAIWLIINLLQATFTELAHDEAYYWMYAQNFGWGYYDHPPMVALFVKLGAFLGHHTLGVRVTTVFSTLAAIFLCKHLVRPAREVLFFYLVSAMVIIHTLAFIITPDVPLLFFMGLFLVGYQQYLKKDSLFQAVWLGICVALIGYSKYQGIVPLVAMLVAYPAIFRRRTFWLIPLTAAVVYFPHLYWQYIHDFPTFRFHLFDRSPSAFKWSFVTDYLLGQLLIWGPLVGIPMFWQVYRYRPVSVFEKSLQYALWGTLGFFLLSCFKGRVEANWTVVAFYPMAYLSYKAIEPNNRLRELVKKLAIASWALFVVARVYVLFPSLPRTFIVTGQFQGWRTQMQELATQVGDYPLVVYNSYKLASKYAFYTQKPVHCVGADGYSGKHYDFLYEKEKALQGKTVIRVGNDLEDTTDSIYFSAEKPLPYFKTVNYRSYNRLKIETNLPKKAFVPGEIVELPLNIYNPTEDTVYIDHSVHPVRLNYQVFRYKKRVLDHTLPEQIPYKKIAPRANLPANIRVQVPNEKGSYRLRLSLHVGNLHRGKNSFFYPFEVE